jgi:hypothetical protein
MYVNVARYLAAYWTVEPTNMSGPFSYDVSYSTGNHGDIVIRNNSHPSPIEAYKFSGGLWTKGGSYNQATATFTWNGLTSFSDFTGGTQLEEEPLPLTLLSWHARTEGKNTVLTSWNTASERNLSHFTIERLDEQGNVEAIGKVKAKSKEMHAGHSFSYTFLDENPAFGKRYYRLKQVDEDGKYYYSHSIAISRHMKGNIQHYPNPLSHTSITLLFPQNLDEILEWQIFDLQGRQIAFGKSKMENQKNLEIRETKQLKTGLYQISILGVFGKQTLRIAVK